MTDTEQVQPEQGQGQPTPPDPTPAASVAPPAAPAAQSPAPGPWSNDLATLFPDEVVRNTVDEFIRSKVQPYTTQLEQKASVAQNASRLWSDLEQSPIDTYVAITNELFGEEAAQALLNTIQTQVSQPPEQQAPGAPPQQAQPQQLDPRLEAMYEKFVQDQAQSQYDEGLAAIQNNPNTQDVDVDLIHPFVAASGGDFNQAVEMYRQFYAQFTDKLAPGEPAAPVPPPVVGSDTSTSTPSSTPTEPKSQTLDDAINDFMDEQRANREAPPVGTA